MSGIVPPAANVNAGSGGFDPLTSIMQYLQGQQSQYGLNSAIAGNTQMGNGYAPNINQYGGVGTVYGPGMPGQPGGSGGADLSQFNQQLSQQSMSPLDQLLQQEQSQLNGIGNYTNYMMPSSAITSMAQNLTNAQYDPQINNLLGQIAQQKQQSGINQNYASQMYNALGDSYTADIPKVQAQVASEQQAAKDQYTGAQQSLQQQYQQQSGQQQAALDKLGIQAAQGGGSSGNQNVAAQNAPGVQGVGQQQTTDQNYLQGQLKVQQQQAQNLLAEQGQSDTQYQQSMADTSKLQGANDVQLLRNSLANYLTGANTQEQSLVSAKANALAGMEGQLNWQNIQNAQTQYQNAFNRIMAENGFGLDVQKEADTNTNNLNTILAQLGENQNQYGQGTVNRPGTTGNMGGPTGAATQLSNLFAQQGLNSKDAPAIETAVNNTMMQVAQTDANNTKNGMRPLPTDPAAYMSILQQQLQQQGITNPQELAAAYQALLAYNQQLK